MKHIENTGKTHGAYRENTGNIQGKHMEPTGKTHGAHRENMDYDMNTPGMKVPFKFLFRLIAP